MQIDPSQNRSSYAFWENVSAKCHQKVLANLFPMQNPDWRLSAIMAAFWPREEEQGAAALRRRAVKMRSACDSHFKPFWMFCFWHLNARPSRTKTVCGGRAHNWFWRSYLGKPGDYELFKRAQFYRQIKITCFSSELFCILIALVRVHCHLLNQTLCSARSIQHITKILYDSAPLKAKQRVSW